MTLDSVICCYPYLSAMVGAAVRGRPRLVGLTYPRDVWWMLAFMRLFNFAHALRGSPERYFVYRHAPLRGLMTAARYVEIHDGGPLVACRRLPRRLTPSRRGRLCESGQLALGDTVNITQRLSSAAAARELLLSDATLTARATRVMG